jgi:hypothetical protein
MRAWGISILFFCGCGGKSTRAPRIEFDAGADSDSDVDVDVDVDTDTDTDTGTGEGCLPDANEANDSPETATAVADGTRFDDLTICPGDVDFFAVDLEVGHQVDFDVLFNHLDTRDIDIELLAPDGTQVWDSTSGDDDEHISFWPWAALGAGRFVLRVYGWEAPPDYVFEGNTYDLVVTVHPDVPCDPDAAEDDDTPATAGPSPAPDRGGAYGVCPGDPDHFTIDANAGQRILAFADYFSPWGHLDVEILDPDGASVLADAFDYDPARGDQGRELARWDALVDGTYVVRVSGAADVTNDYFYVAFLQDAPLCVMDDAFEENDYAGWPAALPTGLSQGLSVCWGDDDWYTIEAADGQAIGIDVLFTHDAGADIDVILFGPGGTEVTRSESDDDDERIDWVATETGTYLFWVYGWRGSENDYSIDLTVE